MTEELILKVRDRAIQCYQLFFKGTELPLSAPIDISSLGVWGLLQQKVPKYRCDEYNLDYIS